MKPLRSLAVLLLLYRRKSEGPARRSSRPGSVHAELQEWIAKAVAAGTSRCLTPVCLRTRVRSQCSEHGPVTTVSATRRLDWKVRVDLAFRVLAEFCRGDGVALDLCGIERRRNNARARCQEGPSIPVF